MTEGIKIKVNEAEEIISKLEDVLFENIEEMVFLISTAGKYGVYMQDNYTGHLSLNSYTDQLKMKQRLKWTLETIELLEENPWKMLQDI